MADLKKAAYGGKTYTIPTYDDTALAGRVSANETAIADRYTKQETDDLIADELSKFDHLDYQIVDTLPATGEAGVRYLVKHPTDAQYEEYIYVNDQWHDIGSTADVDLSAYYDKTETDTLLADKQDTLTFDDAPTENSNNPAKSGGIKTALDAKQDELTAGQGIRIENSEIDTPLLDSEYFTKGAVLLPDETGNFTLGSDRKISYGEWSDTEFYAAGMALSDFGNYVLEFNTPNGADLYAVTSVSTEETDQYGTSVRIDLQNHDGGTMESIIAKLRTDLSTITFSFGSRGVVATSFSVHERRDVRNVSGIVNEDLDVASKTDLASGVAEAKAYADGKTLSATGWGVVTTGRGEIGSAGNPKVIDVSQYNFASADDYEVAVTSLNNNCNVACTAKTATSFTVVGSGWGQSVGERPFSYVITAKGYGAVAYTGALPEGGTTGQSLVKRSGDDGDVAWDDAGSGTVDQTYNATSTNAQSGTAVAEAVATKQDALTAGTGVKIENNEISFNYVTAGKKAVVYSGVATGNQTINISEMQFSDLTDFEVEVTGSVLMYRDGVVETIIYNTYPVTIRLIGGTASGSHNGTTVSRTTNSVTISVSAVSGWEVLSAGLEYTVYYTGVHVDGSIPTGGTTGQALVKKSDADGDMEWDDIGGTVTLDDTMSDTSENGVKNNVIKNYVDNKTLNPTGWGVAKIGQVSLSSTTEVTVDITDLGFMSVDDYEVFLTLNDATTSNIVPRVASKTLTSFGIKKSSSGSNIPVNYVVIGKGYGGGSSYRDLILDTAMSGTSENGVQNKVVKAYVDGMISVDDALNAESTRAVQNKVVTEQINSLASQLGNLGEPFRVKQFQITLNAELPMVTEEVANTAIPNVDLTIDDTEGADYQIAGMISYEVYDAETGGNRINCFPVCQFTMNTQKTLRIRMMCGGTTRKTAKRISAWVLLKHR